MTSKKPKKKEPKISIKKNNVKQKVYVKVHVDNSKKVGKTKRVYTRESSGGGSYTPVFIQSGNPPAESYHYTNPIPKPEQTIPTLVTQVQPTRAGFTSTTTPVASTTEAVSAAQPARKRVRLNVLPSTTTATPSTTTSTTSSTTSTSAPPYIVPAATTANSISEQPTRRQRRPNRQPYQIAEEKRLKEEKRKRREREKEMKAMKGNYDADTDSDYGKKKA